MYNHQLDTFLAVCQHGSFTLAAKKCFITPAAVVQQINLLEKSMGVKLFLRTNRGVVLTPSGEILRNLAPEFIHHSKAIIDQVKKAAGHQPIRLGWSTGVEDSRFLSECLALRDANEDLQISLARISGSVVEGLAQNEFDLCQYAMCPGIAQYGYEFTPLYTVRQCVVLPPEHPLGQKHSVRLEDLSGMELVLLAPGVLSDHDDFRRMVHASGLPIRLIEMENYNFETRSTCYFRKLPFLGMMPLLNQYAPLRCLSAEWEVPVHIGLISKTPAWADLAILVRELSHRLGRSEILSSVR